MGAGERARRLYGSGRPLVVPKGIVLCVLGSLDERAIWWSGPLGSVVPVVVGDQSGGSRVVVDIGVRPGAVE